MPAPRVHLAGPYVAGSQTCIRCGVELHDRATPSNAYAYGCEVTIRDLDDPDHWRASEVEPVPCTEDSTPAERFAGGVEEVARGMRGVPYDDVRQMGCREAGGELAPCDAGAAEDRAIEEALHEQVGQAIANAASPPVTFLWMQVHPAQSWQAIAVLEDMRVVFLLPTIFGGMITRGVGSLTYEDEWMFDSMADARRGFAAWALREFEGEPEGWVRHKPSNRRRPGGDPAREEVRP